MELSFEPATRLAARRRAGEFSSVELLDHYIARIERLDHRINAVVVRDFDRARDRARALDAGGDRNVPLFGVPMTVKESFDVVGLPTTRGHVEALSHRAVTSSLAIRRLEAAGAVVFGKTNVPVDLADWQSYNPVYGSTSNPWNVAHTPGGSSGGSAASMAAGFAGLEVGTDIGGSVRVPAHYCGVFGHKPTWALCPSYGDPATSPAAPTDISVLGPIARSAADLAAALDVLAGPDPSETGLTFNLPAPRTTTLRELRVAVWSHEQGQETDSELVAKLDELAALLEREGATVSRTARPPFAALDAYHLYLRLLDAAWSGRQTEQALADKRAGAARRAPDDMSADAIMLRGVDMTHRTWLGLNEQRAKYRRGWSAFFGEWDVLLCPPIATAALPHMQDGNTWDRTMAVNGRTIPYNDMLFWPGLTCGYHLPASIAPLGFTRAGLPLGVQIVGPIYGDRTTIAVAGMLEQAWLGFTPPQGWE
jgi:amidase